MSHKCAAVHIQSYPIKQSMSKPDVRTAAEEPVRNISPTNHHTERPNSSLSNGRVREANFRCLWIVRGHASFPCSEIVTLVQGACLPVLRFKYASCFCFRLIYLRPSVCSHSKTFCLDGTRCIRLYPRISIVRLCSLSNGPQRDSASAGWCSNIVWVR
jgi:hypothetical protein